MIITTLQGGTLHYYPSFLPNDKANELFDIFHKTLQWQQDEITIFGKTHDVPRLQAWYGEEGSTYSYSGIKMIPHSFTPELLDVKNAIEQSTDFKFNSVLANLYRTGQDSNGWHADNEKELGKNPVIASITLGQERVFKLKHRNDKALKKDILLQHGSLLIMCGEMQHHWLHTIAKTKKPIGERINLTFRHVHS